MGRIWMPGGGGGIDLDVVTAASGDILKGKVIVGTDGEPLTGVLELTGNAADSQVLSGKTYYNTDAKGKRTGTMSNQGAVTSSLNAGDSYTIPAGYHNGSGKVTANSLSSQTKVQSGKTAAGAAQVLAGYEAWVNGGRVTGTMANQGAKTASLNCGGSYTIPAGYHNGSGKVTANSLSSQTSANAAAGHILSGKTAWVNGSKVTGTMTNHTGTPQHIDARRVQNNRFEVAVAAGYHGYSWAGNSYEYMEFSEVASTLGLTAAKLAKGQTVCGVAGTYTSDANAVAGNILSGKTAYVNGSKVTGTMTVQSILSFNVAPSGIKNVIFTWKNPSKGAFSGVIIVYKTGSYPTSINDGTRIYKGSGNNTSASGTSSAICTMPSENTTYYFRAYSYAIKNNAEWIHSTTYTATATTGKSIYIFTSSGTFTVPKGVSAIDIFCVGGGGGGGSSRNSNSDSAWDRQASGGGGGGGYTKTKLKYPVASGSTYGITVGAGGVGGIANDSSTLKGSGKRGGTSKFGSILYVEGGWGGGGGYDSKGGYGGSGGSGGGGGNAGGEDNNIKGSNGGSNGSDGENGVNTAGGAIEAYPGGTGQGITTRAFGENSGTLYAGGGSGGHNGWSAWDSKYSGYGGAGGGGNSPVNTKPTAGGTNTGGGGGGAGMSENSLDAAPSFPGGNGGSGIVLIRIASISMTL